MLEDIVRIEFWHELGNCLKKNTLQDGNSIIIIVDSNEYHQRDTRYAVFQIEPEIL